MALQVQLITLCTIADLICGPSRTLEETAMHGVTRRNDRNVSRPMHTRSGRVLWPGFQPPQCPVTADRASKPRPSGGLRAPLSDRFVSDVRAKRSTSSAVQPAWLSGATSRRSRRIAFCPADRSFSQPSARISAHDLGTRPLWSLWCPWPWPAQAGKAQQYCAG